ncbi:TPA: HU family DNA-binding protein [Photobacterium damselae]
MIVNREKLSAKLAERMGFKVKHANKCVETYFSLIVELAQAGNVVFTPKVGAYSFVDKPSRPGYNFKLAERIVIPPRSVLRCHFKVGGNNA